MDAGAGFVWPPRSSARMRAGLRSALKTACSGFLFQNGGRRFKWFRQEKNVWKLMASGHSRALRLAWPQYAQRLALDRSREEGIILVNALAALLETASMDDEGMVRDMLFQTPTLWEAVAAFMADKPSGFTPALGIAMKREWMWFPTALIDAMRLRQSDLLPPPPPPAAAPPRWNGEDWRQAFLNAAARAARIDLVEMYSAELGEGGALCKSKLYAFHAGCGGSVAVLTHGGYTIPHQVKPLVVNGAASQGHTEMLAHLLSLERRHESSFSSGAFVTACEHGALHVLEWWFRVLLIHNTPQRGDAVTRCLVAAAGHKPQTQAMRVLRFLLETRRLPYTSLELVANNLCLHATEDTLSNIEYLLEGDADDDTPAGRIITCATAVAALSATNLQPDLIRFLASKLGDAEWATCCRRAAKQLSIDAMELCDAETHRRAMARAVAGLA